MMKKIKEYLQWGSIEIEINLKLGMMRLSVTHVILHTIISI